MARPDPLRPNYVSNHPLKRVVSVTLEHPQGARSTRITVVRGLDSVVLRLPPDLDGEGTTSRGSNFADAYTRLVTDLASRGFTVHACGSCAAFLFSSLSYQFSGGAKGHCTVNRPASTGQKVVALLDRCDVFKRRSPDRSWSDDEV